MQRSVGPRASKEEFMHALGLDPRNHQHEQYYRAMRDEAIIIYNTMNQNTTYLLDSIRNDPSTRPPFFWHHIRPESQRWGIMEIWRNAGPATRPFFDRGITNGEYGPNWVTAWLLYSVFRSRDVRNNRNRRRGDENLSVSRRKEKGGSNTAAAKEPAVKKGYYDPVRNGTL